MALHKQHTVKITLGEGERLAAQREHISGVLRQAIGARRSLYGQVSAVEYSTTRLCTLDNIVKCVHREGFDIYIT